MRSTTRGLLSVAGPGAIQAPGIIPSMILGALPQKNAIKRNLAKAKGELSPRRASGLSA